MGCKGQGEKENVIMSILIESISSLTPTRKEKKRVDARRSHLETEDAIMSIPGKHEKKHEKKLKVQKKRRVDKVVTQCWQCFCICPHTVELPTVRKRFRMKHSEHLA